MLAHGVGRHLLVAHNAADVEPRQIDLALWDPATLVVLRGLGLLGLGVVAALGEAVASGLGHVHGASDLPRCTGGVVLSHC